MNLLNYKSLEQKLLLQSQSQFPLPQSSPKIADCCRLWETIFSPFWPSSLEPIRMRETWRQKDYDSATIDLYMNKVPAIEKVGLHKQTGYIVSRDYLKATHDVDKMSQRRKKLTKDLQCKRATKCRGFWVCKPIFSIWPRNLKGLKLSKLFSGQRSWIEIRSFKNRIYGKEMEPWYIPEV